eukprot:298860_1
MNTATINKYKHVFVEVKFSFLSTDDSIRIQLSSECWESNLNCILQNQFGDILSTKIPSPAVLEIVTLNTLVNCWLQTKSEVLSPRSDKILNFLSPVVSPKHSLYPAESPDSFSRRRFVDMSFMSMQELDLLDRANSPEPQDFNLSWDHVVECIKHEMWPKVASVIKALLKRKNEKGNQMIDIYDVSDESIDHIVNILKERGLPSEECEYLKQFVV